MTLRSKMVATISAFCLVLAMLIIGVWAAQSVKVEMGGSLTFDANDVNVKIEGTIEGTSEPQTLDTLIFSANEGQSSGDVETWKNKALTFGRDDDNVYDIVITIKITNLSYENAVNVKILDNYQTIENVDKTITRDDGQYTAGSTYALPKSTTESESTTTFKITFSVADKNQPVSGVQFGYTIDLSDESYVAPDPVVSSDSSLGTVDFKDNGDGTTTLIATPNESAVFVGWKDEKGKFLDLNTWDMKGNVLALSLFSITSTEDNVDPIFESEFAYYNDERIDISQISSFKQTVENVYATNSISKYEYENVIQTLNDIENQCFSYIVKSDNSIYTAVFSDNEKLTVSENGYTFDYYDDANIAFITSYNGNESELQLPKTITSKIDSQVLGFKENMNGSGMEFIPNQVYFTNTSNITKVTIPNNYYSIARGAFKDLSSLYEVVFENDSSCKRIGDSAFSGCEKLGILNLPDSIKIIGYLSFDNSGLTEFPFSENSKLEYIDDYSFYGCLFSEVIIPDNVTYIGWYAFAHSSDNSSNLNSVTFGSNSKIMKIDNFAFNNCSLLERFELNVANPPVLGTTGGDLFRDCENIIIYVPAESIATYQEYCNNGTNGWDSSLLNKLQPIV